jgi:chaperonin GroEL
MIKDNLFTKDIAREKLMRGVQRAADAVGVTLGTGGSNSLIEAIQNPGFYTTNDGISILASIRFEDTLEEMGRRILFEAVSRANKSSGDGSSTTCVLTAAILEEGLKHIGETSPMEIKRSLEACIPLIEKSINEQKKELVKDGVIDFKLLKQVAEISAEDEGIGKMIAEIYEKIGAEGLISWEASKTPDDWYSIGTGLKIEGATYVSPYMCDMAGTNFKNEATLENPLILLARRKISSQADLENLVMTLVNQQRKGLVIFVDEVEPLMINSFVLARAPQKLGMRILVIKMPVILNDEWWVDLAHATGATVIDEASGIKLKKVQMEHLGRVAKIKVDTEATYLDGIKDFTKLEQGSGMVFDYIKSLQEDGSDDALRRIARLNTKTAIYHVGAHSESALAYRRLKTEDALNAAQVALQNGIVVGGGLALSHASEALLNGNDTTIGATILDLAMKKPIETIIRNTGANSDDVMCEIALGYLQGDKKIYGFDSKSGKIVDMFEAGIIDPASVVLSAIKNAIGVAASILTIGTVVTLPRETESLSGMVEKMVDQRTSVQQ